MQIKVDFTSSTMCCLRALENPFRIKFCGQFNVNTFTKQHAAGQRYAFQSWLNQLDISKLEKAQEVTTKRVLGIRNLSDPKSLERDKLRRRKIRGDLIETFTIIQGFVSVDPTEFFSLSESRELRGHPFMLAKPRVNTSTHQNFYVAWVINH